MTAAWSRLTRDIEGCRRCPRLIEHCRTIARERRRAFREETYWGGPVAGFGDREARVLVLGLAPGAHGANRTGRMFTGDRSGEWLYRALHAAGLSDRAVSTARDDGLRLRCAWISAACRCAPPQNRPTATELASCAEYLDREVELLSKLRVVVALGGVAWTAALRCAERRAPGRAQRPRPRFAHGTEASLALHRSGAPLALLGCYHPSQQNTFTGRLTRPMLDGVMRRAARLAARS